MGKVEHLAKEYDLKSLVKKPSKFDKLWKFKVLTSNLKNDLGGQRSLGKKFHFWLKNMTEKFGLNI